VTVNGEGDDGGGDDDDDDESYDVTTGVSATAKR